MYRENNSNYKFTIVQLSNRFLCLIYDNINFCYLKVYIILLWYIIIFIDRFFHQTWNNKYIFFNLYILHG
jgi:hypothetical protein